MIKKKKQLNKSAREKTGKWGGKWGGGGNIYIYDLAMIKQIPPPPIKKQNVPFFEEKKNNPPVEIFSLCVYV